MVRRKPLGHLSSPAYPCEIVDGPRFEHIGWLRWSPRLRGARVRRPVLVTQWDAFMADYNFDVFLSVKDDDVFNEWVQNSFLPLFRTYLKNDILEACGRQTRDVYYYVRNIKPGDPWPDELRNAIRGSCLALALCSPEYFSSKWCLSEFYSFMERGSHKNVKVLV